VGPFAVADLESGSSLFQALRRPLSIRGHAGFLPGTEVDRVILLFTVPAGIIEETVSLFTEGIQKWGERVNSAVLPPTAPCW